MQAFTSMNIKKKMAIKFQDQNVVIASVTCVSDFKIYAAYNVVYLVHSWNWRNNVIIYN